VVHSFVTHSFHCAASCFPTSHFHVFPSFRKTTGQRYLAELRFLVMLFKRLNFASSNPQLAISVLLFAYCSFLQSPPDAFLSVPFPLVFITPAPNKVFPFARTPLPRRSPGSQTPSCLANPSPLPSPWSLRPSPSQLHPVDFFPYRLKHTFLLPSNLLLPLHGLFALLPTFPSRSFFPASARDPYVSKVFTVSKLVLF